MSSSNCRMRSVSMAPSSLSLVLCTTHAVVSLAQPGAAQHLVEEFGVCLTAGWFRPHHWRGVVVDDTPLVTHVLIHIGSQYTGHLECIGCITEVFHTGHPGHMAVKVHGHVSD